MDRFKKYLHENAGSLDTDMPVNNLWEQIEQQTIRSRQRRHNNIIIFRYAAAACIIAITFGITKQEFSKRQNTQPEVSQKDPAPSERMDTITGKTVAPQLSIAVADPANSKSLPHKKTVRIKSAGAPGNSYENLINERMKRLGNIPVLAASPGYFNVFTSQLTQMDKDERAIKKEIRHNGYSDEMMDQLIEVYQQKLNLLKRFQSEIQKINNRVKQQRVVDSSTKPYYIQL